MIKPNTKLDLKSGRVIITASEAKKVLKKILSNVGCNKKEIASISEHLVDTSLCGMESHGIMRILEYVKQYKNGYMYPDRTTTVKKNKYGGVEVNELNLNYYL